jgi:hypothetical protein
MPTTIHGSPPSFSPTHNHRSSGESHTTIDGMLLGLLGPYLQCVVSTFNTCSRGSTHRSLTNTDGGYKLGGANFPHHTLCPSQPTVLRFKPKSLIQFPVYKIPPMIPKFRFRGPKAITWYFDHTTIYRGLHLRLAKTIDLSLAIGSTRMDQKVILLQLRHHFTSYNLMRKQDSYLRYKDKQNSRIDFDAPGLALLGIGVSVLNLSLLLEFWHIVNQRLCKKMGQVQNVQCMSCKITSTKHFKSSKLFY